jgi:hypothetical protein
MPSLHLPKTAPAWCVRFTSRSDAATPLAKARTLCGRDPNCDVVLPSLAVSRQHFQIHCRDKGCYLEDLHSPCGTFLDRGEGYNNGRLRADCEIQAGGWQIIGLMPLRAGDVFGHPTRYLTLEPTAPITPDDWTFGANSQGMLLAVRGTRLADPSRLRQFLDRCMALVAEQDRDEIAFRRLREHSDTWSAAAGLARYVVAAASSGLLWNLRGDVQLRQQLDAQIWRACEDAESVVCGLLREFFGNPFRPTSMNPCWLTPVVLSLATAAYEERQLPEGILDPARLAILADALEDAGCTDAGVLDHLRGPGTHYRGCWAVDLALAKE